MNENVDVLKDSDESRQKVWDMIKDIRIASMVTLDHTMTMRSRPMNAQKVADDGSLWFFTHSKSAKVDHIEHVPDILLVYADPEHQNYVSLYGRGDIVRDRATVKRLWNEMVRLWFPQGPEDPDLVLIRVNVTSAEYWDSPSATMVIAFGYLIARLTGETPEVGEHERVAF
jgi:general stress protein 26